MTRQPYSPEMLDLLAMEMLDIAAILRKMAQRSRQYPVEGFALHDKKAREWIAQLVRWAHKAQGELEMRIIETCGAQRAATSP